MIFIPLWIFNKLIQIFFKLKNKKQKMKVITITVGCETKHVLDINRLHRVHNDMANGSGVERRAGSTYYNFDSCLRIVELQDVKSIFYVTTNPDGNETSRANWYKREFVRFLQNYCEYAFHEVMPIGAIYINGVKVLFVTYNKYKSMSLGYSEHYLIYDL